MNTFLYPRLAVGGIKKNKRLYIPYILTAVGMVMMYFIMHSLSASPTIRGLHGGGNIGFVLSLGKFVIALFALLFLTYTNTFLIRRRNREYGLYNVLGMGKSGIAHITVWESVIVAVIGLTGGIALGIALSKLAELMLLRMLRLEVDYSITISIDSVLFTLMIFVAIFALLLLKSLWQIFRTDPIELVRSESYGEKPPRANWIITLLGAVLLAVAYYLAVTIVDPVAATVVFFVAVIMVIVATYLLFISGSVTICRALQRNKKYYYKKQHFASVSSMVFRMKRNGAGLASICILSTMVLVMISFTSSLFIGSEGVLHNRYPQDITISVHPENLSDFLFDYENDFITAFEKSIDEKGITPKNVISAKRVTATTVQRGDKLLMEESVPTSDYHLYRNIFFFSCDSYEKMTGTAVHVDKGEAIVLPIDCEWTYDSFNFENCHFRLRTDYPAEVGSDEAIKKYSIIGGMAMPYFIVIINDFDELRPIDNDAELKYRCNYIWSYSFDTDADNDAEYELYLDIHNEVGDILDGVSGFYYTTRAIAADRTDYYSTFGGLFFLAIMLSIVFIFAAVLIIYYKQLSEGYEDQSRFEIMQKVGMTKSDIKKSVNSQIITVFYAPLLFSGLHLLFAFPLINKIMLLCGMTDTKLAIIVTAAAFVVFAVFYALIYKLTAGAYYRIVSGANEKFAEN